MKKAVITGASSCLGHEIATKLIEKGVEIINLSRHPCKLEVINIETDLTNNKSIAHAIETISNEHQDVDLIILNAGLMHWHETGECPPDEIDNDFAVNVTGEIKVANGLIPLIKKNKGDIAAVGSTSSFVSYGGDSIYVAAKHAMRGYIKALQAEFKKQDVRIIGFYPGGFKSQFHIKAGSDIKQEELMDPKDLAQLLISTLKLPRNMEVSEIIINRKKPK